MNKLSRFFSYNYLFTIDRVSPSSFDKLLGVIGLACILLAIVLKVAARLAPSPVDKAFRERAYTLFLTVGALEVIWFGARYQAIRFFGSHFFAFLIILVGLIWLGYLLKDLFINYRSAKAKWEKEQVKLKYLSK